MNAPIDWWASIKKLGLNVILGYIASWVYAAIAYLLLKPWLGKVRAAGVAYGSSWLVWMGVTAALQILNPSGGAEKIESEGAKGEESALH